jgi:hypothetical protein
MVSSSEAKKRYLASIFSCDVFIIRLGLRVIHGMKIPLKSTLFQGDAQVFKKKI